MEDNRFYNTNPHQQGFIELGLKIPGSGSVGWRHGDHSRSNQDIESNLHDDGRRFKPAQVYNYDHMVNRSSLKDEQDESRWRERQIAAGTARSRYDDYDKQALKYREYSDDSDRKQKWKEYEQGTEDSSGRRGGRSRSIDHDRERESDRRDRDSRKDRERKSRRDESSYSDGKDDSEYRPRRRSRSKDRNRSDRDRRHRDSDRERRHRDLDREDARPRHDHDEGRGDTETTNKELPWVPPPLPEHLRHMQVQLALVPVASSSQYLASSRTKTKPPKPTVQNKFQNDGSFLEMFRQKMQSQGAVSEDSNTSECPSTSGAPAEVGDPTAASGPTLAANSSGLPVIAKRRISKILKTGIVQKKKKEDTQGEEEENKEGDGWSTYMKEVQKYRANKCIENEASRPPLVK